MICAARRHRCRLHLGNCPTADRKNRAALLNLSLLSWNPVVVFVVLAALTRI